VRVAVVPATLLLLPEYGGATDPVADLRGAVGDAVGWLLEEAARVVVLGADTDPANAGRGMPVPAALRIAQRLLGGHPAVWAPQPGDVPDLRDGDAVLVVADGSACRSEKAPGHLDPRAVTFDDTVESALRDGDPEALAALDAALGEELWCRSVPALQALGRLVNRPEQAVVDLADAPFGVAYWVARWTC
jgi:hypothetical protein